MALTVKVMCKFFLEVTSDCFFIFQDGVLMLSQTAENLEAYNMHKLSVQLPSEVQQ